MRLRTGIVWMCSLAAVFAQTPPPGDTLLPRIRLHMQQRLSDVPNYTCRETIERSWRASKGKEFHQIDRLLLEVAQVGGRELLAWPGGKFESQPLSAFASGGLMSNGTFAMHARSIFLGDRVMFTLVNPKRGGESKLVRYDYKVPQFASGYRVKGGPYQAVVGFHGSVFADPETLDVSRIEIYSDPIPHEIDMSKADMVIEYQRVKIGSTEALLPKTAEVTMVRRESHSLLRNLTTFSDCHQYGSESSISYLAPEEVPRVQTDRVVDEAVMDVQLPAGLRLPINLQTPVDSAQSAAGLPVVALVDEDVLDAGRVLVPKGARLSGRVRSLERLGPPMRGFEIGLEFTEASWPGARAHFKAGLEEVDAGSGAQLSPMGTFYVKGAEFRLGLGFKMVWRILP